MLEVTEILQTITMGVIPVIIGVAIGALMFKEVR